MRPVRPFPKDQPLGPWYRLAAVILWPPMMTITRRDWRGVENLGEPGDGIVVATNHMSWFDPMVIAHFLNDNDRPPRYLAKDAVFDVPVAGKIIGGAGQIPVYRESENAQDAVRAAVAAVDAGEAVVVYPEGTLTRDPDLWPMTGKTGAARIALLSGHPVIPVAHWGAQQVMGPYAKEFHAFPPKLVKVIAGPPVDLDDLRDLPLTSDVLTEATSRIMDAIAGLLATLRDESPPSGRWNPKTGRREPVRHPLPPDRNEAPDVTVTRRTAKKSRSSATAAPARTTATKKTATKKTAAKKTAAKKTATKKAASTKAAPAKVAAKKTTKSASKKTATVTTPAKKPATRAAKRA